MAEKNNARLYERWLKFMLETHGAYKWLSALSGMLTMQDEQRANLDQALEVTKALMIATAKQFPAKTGGFALNWICSAEKI